MEGVKKRKRTMDFIENAKTLLDDGDEVESSRSSHWDDILTDEERDQRSVCVSGIPVRATREEVDKFFSILCKVINIELVVDPSSRVRKAMGYIEFDDPIYVPMALSLSGQLLLGQLIEVNPLNSGDPSAGERSYIHTGKKNFLDKPQYLMTSDEKIDASTKWRELTNVENKRFFYNMDTGERRWELPHELAAARNRTREAARRRQARNPVSTRHLPPVTAPSSCQQVSADVNMMTWSSQAYPWPQYLFYPWPQ